VVLVTLNTAG